METALKKELIEFCRDIIPEAECTFMDPKEAVFEENVKMKCFYCKKYDRNWRCPPNIPEFDYRKIFSEFDEGLFVAVKIDTTDKLKFEIIRKDTNNNGGRQIKDNARIFLSGRFRLNVKLN